MESRKFMIEVGPDGAASIYEVNAQGDPDFVSPLVEFEMANITVVRGMRLEASDIAKRLSDPRSLLVHSQFHNSGK